MSVHSDLEVSTVKGFIQEGRVLNKAQKRRLARNLPHCPWVIEKAGEPYTDFEIQQRGHKVMAVMSQTINDGGQTFTRITRLSLEGMEERVRKLVQKKKEPLISKAALAKLRQLDAKANPIKTKKNSFIFSEAAILRILNAAQALASEDNESISAPIEPTESTNRSYCFKIGDMEIIAQALRSLPKPKQEILALRYSYPKVPSKREVARRLKRASSTVVVHERTALIRIRSLIQSNDFQATI